MIFLPSAAVAHLIRRHKARSVGVKTLALPERGLAVVKVLQGRSKKEEPDLWERVSWRLHLRPQSAFLPQR